MTTTLEWMVEVAKARMLQRSVMNRVFGSIALGLSEMVVHLTDPPTAGSPERQEWEQCCDRCGYVSALDEPTYHPMLPLPLGRIEVVVSALLCKACGDALGIDGATVEWKGEPKGGLSGLVADIHSNLPGAAFGLALGEQLEPAEHQAIIWDKRREKR